MRFDSGETNWTQSLYDMLHTPIIPKTDTYRLEPIIKILVNVEDTVHSDHTYLPSQQEVWHHDPDMLIKKYLF